MGWRDEITTAVDEWIAVEGGAGQRPRWRRVGRAARAGDPGRYTVDLRGTELNPDQLESLRLAGPEESGVEAGFAVTETMQSGSSLTVKVAEFADPVDPFLWVLQQPPTFLLESLRDGIAALGDTPLGSLLASGRPAGEPARAEAPAGLFPEQAEAYRACLGTGVHLVWGPPGTGKTMVLTLAIGHLIAAGKRVLLVSATNIAVDNALKGVLRGHRHTSGDIVRVGPPQLKEIAENPEVSLPLMVRARLADVEGRRARVSAELLGMRRRAEDLAELEAGLVRFDAASYAQARALVTEPFGDAASRDIRVEELKKAAREVGRSLAAADRDLDAALKDRDDAADSRHLWEQVDALRGEADQVENAATAAESAALLREERLREAQRTLRGIEQRTGFARRRSRKERTEAQAACGQAESQFSEAHDHALKARGIADRRRARIATQTEEMIRAIPFSDSEIGRRDATARAAAIRHQTLTRSVGELRTALATAEDEAGRAHRAEALIATAEEHGWPARHGKAVALRSVVVAEAARKGPLEKQYKEIQEEYERLARDAQGEIVKNARLVATTLARFRTNRHVFSGHYDVVLIDEVGAASLPEVLLAVSHAERAAVLLGDFMQLGPVVPRVLKDKKRPDIQRWLVPDVFQHCGITDPAAARTHAACTTLVTQNRFGRAVMGLVNGLAYGGVLQAGPVVRHSRSSEDPEIVLIDTDGLHELAHVHLTGPSKGWWAAGPLISRALIDLHAGDGENAGVVTPYGDQAEATLEALRDIERAGGPSAEVGTAHRFQGREFPIVVFDTVEGEHSRPLWMAKASSAPEASDWMRSGIRLFNVAMTRVQTRVYVIASGARIREVAQKAPDSPFGQLDALIGTPGVRVLPARTLITPPELNVPRGEFGDRLADVLARHVEVSDVDDETTFYASFVAAVRSARTSLWLWAPWVARRIRMILPELRAAVDRGVRVTVFVRDSSDELQKRPANASLVEDLRAVVHTVVPMHVMHQKIVVVDEKTVMLGSLNALSQSWTREVMVTMRGAYFARKILAHEHAEIFARPPKCPRCGQGDIEIRRGAKQNWYWRCYNRRCPTGGGNKAWKKDIDLWHRPGSTKP
ncbi:AAA domain-containing protein [Actinacidiphila yeochonensis]|uniref:AAA domain-containing protein n=1 Tax=Actinacidiphila yeochonensis TaxID=89050 RepID=UPI00056D8DF9|nr:AAA domain-containing protein [Actinacidiphila yeochonensis]